MNLSEKVEILVRRCGFRFEHRNPQGYLLDQTFEVWCERRGCEFHASIVPITSSIVFALLGMMIEHDQLHQEGLVRMKVKP